MANTEQEFTTELRGYKRSEVEKVINALRAELIQAAKDRGNLLDELTALKEHLAAVDASGDGSSSATYSGLGSRLEAILRIAEEQSTRIIGQADIDSERMISNAKQEAQSLLESAQREAERVTTDAENRAANTLEGAQEKAEKLVQEATDQAKRLTDGAVEEASAIRGAVATESAKMRASAKRETDALRTEVKREIAELKVVAERELNQAREQASQLMKEVQAERASHELTLKRIQEEAALAKTNLEHEVAETTARLSHDNHTQAEKLAHAAEQARADLDAELSARRAEAERELLDAHQKAVELNNRFLTEAESQLAETKSRVSALRTEHKKITEAIDTGKPRWKTLSSEEGSRGRRSCGDARLATSSRAAEEEATTRVAAAERRLTELRSERNTIAEYIESLRTIVGAVLEAPAPAKRPARAKRSKPRAVAQQSGFSRFVISFSTNRVCFSPTHRCLAPSAMTNVNVLRRGKPRLGGLRRKKIVELWNEGHHGNGRITPGRHFRSGGSVQGRREHNNSRNTIGVNPGVLQNHLCSKGPTNQPRGGKPQPF